MRADAAAAAPHQHAAALALHRAVRGCGAVARMRESEIVLGRSRIHFLSAERGANVVGHTASLLLEVDEAQDVDIEKFDREFRPMASSTNATTVYYGTAWDDASLLERAKQANLEAERRDGRRRHFEYDWQHVARCNPAYGAFVERERQRLGETHPLFLTQYCLKTIAGGGRLFTRRTARAARRCARARSARRSPARRTSRGSTSPAAMTDDALDAATHRATRRVLTIGRLVYPPRRARWCRSRASRSSSTTPGRASRTRRCCRG